MRFRKEKKPEDTAADGRKWDLPGSERYAIVHGGPSTYIALIRFDQRGDLCTVEQVNWNNVMTRNVSHLRETLRKVSDGIDGPPVRETKYVVEGRN